MAAAAQVRGTHSSPPWWAAQWAKPLCPWSHGQRFEPQHSSRMSEGPCARPGSGGTSCCLTLCGDSSPTWVSRGEQGRDREVHCNVSALLWQIIFFLLFHFMLLGHSKELNTLRDSGGLEYIHLYVKFGEGGSRWYFFSGGPEFLATVCPCWLHSNAPPPPPWTGQSKLGRKQGQLAEGKQRVNVSHLHAIYVLLAFAVQPECTAAIRWFQVTIAQSFLEGC